MHSIDYIILVSYLILICLVTWFCRKVKSSHKDFFLAERCFGAIPVGLSVMVTTFSAVNYLALPSEIYSHGLYVLSSLPAFLLAAIPITRYWMPFFNKLSNASVYAFLEEQFNLKVRMLCSCIFLLWRIFWMSIALYASCKIMHLVTSLPILPLILLGGILATGYSAIGGMKAVMWSDVLQFCVLFGSILAAVFLSCSRDSLLSLPSNGCIKPFFPIDWTYLSPDPTKRITLWSGLLGTFVTVMTRFGGDQMVMQRYLSAKSLKAAQHGLWLNGMVATISLALLAVFGLSIIAFALKQGIPSHTPAPKVIAQLLTSFPPGATGLISAGLLAATMSSIDSGLNSCCATLSIDFFERLNLPHISPKLLTILLAFPIIVIAAWVLPTINESQTLFAILNKSVNAIGTPLLAVMICALFWKKISNNAVFLGTLLGSVFTIYASIKITSISLHYYALLSLIASLGSIAFFNLLLNAKSFVVKHFKITQKKLRKLK